MNNLNRGTRARKLNNVTATTDTNEVSMVAKVQDVYSITRQQKEPLTINFKETFAEVKSASGNKYIVTKQSCTCHDFFYRNRECRHMTAVKDSVKSMRFWVGREG